MSDAEVREAMRVAELADRMESMDLVPLSAPTLTDEVVALWYKGMPPGDRTGWMSVDRHYTVMPGQLTVLTGWPGSGKSEWLDALLINLARQAWRFAIFSPENHPVETHIAKFLEKFNGKPFGSGPTERMSLEDVSDGMGEIEEWFGFLMRSVNAKKDVFGIDEILTAAEVRFRSVGAWHSKELKRGLVIDPWNELEHLRPAQMSETEYISQTLTYVRQWARASGTHVWIVAHPQKLRRDDNGKLPVPKPDSISGSQHWWNKCDNAITIWRPLDDPMNQNVQVHVQKIRFKHIGRPGIVDLLYDRITGKYHEPTPKNFSVVA